MTKAQRKELCMSLLCLLVCHYCACLSLTSTSATVPQACTEMLI